MRCEKSKPAGPGQPPEWRDKRRLQGSTQLRSSMRETFNGFSPPPPPPPPTGGGGRGGGGGGAGPPAPFAWRPYFYPARRKSVGHAEQGGPQHTRLAPP